MKRLLIVAFILTKCHPAYAEPFAYATNSVGGWTTLTDEACRYDKTRPEAVSSNAKGEKSYACYWFGKEIIYFQTGDKQLRWLPKKDFTLIRGVV